MLQCCAPSGTETCDSRDDVSARFELWKHKYYLFIFILVEF
jgi:hypothetical protein